MTFSTTRALVKAAPRDRIVVGGKDVTRFRGKQTPMPGYTLSEPLAYGSTTLSFPQVHASLEAIGEGELSWMRPGATVLLQRVHPDGTIVTDYRGVLLTPNVDGRTLTWDVGGQVSGPASLQDVQPRVFHAVRDVGALAFNASLGLNIAMTPQGGPITGIKIPAPGDLSMLDYVNHICSVAQDEDGRQWTFMPKTWGSGGPWQFRLKNRTTVHATVFTDDARAVARLSSPIEDTPNRLYGRGTTPDGLRVRNSKLPRIIQGPAPAYPMAGGATMGPGTTDADTITGSGVSALRAALLYANYFDRRSEDTGAYDAAYVSAVKALQREADLAVTGVVNLATWQALFDLEASGYSTTGARIYPMVEAPEVRDWNRTSSGNLTTRNPAHDPSVLIVDRTVTNMDGMTKPQMVAHLRGQYARARSQKNWVGTIELNQAGGFAGQWAADSSPTGDDILAPRDFRPGMNVWLPLFDGGTLVHVSGISVREDGGASLTVDTQARDLMEVGAVIARNKEARRNLRREFRQGNRATSAITRDEHFGQLRQDVPLQGDQWNRVPVPMGQFGQVNKTVIQLSNDAEFCLAVTSIEKTVKQMQRRIGNPFPVNSDGESKWDTGAGADWLEDRIVLYASGDEEQPLGYFPRRKFSDAGKRTSASATGRWVDSGSWSYATLGGEPIVWLFIWPDRDCVLRSGRLFSAQEDDAI